MEVRLSDEELAAVVQRAHEINSLQGRVDSGSDALEDYVVVAEEMGVPRDAMMQALNERFAFLSREIEPGTLVFAMSEDGRHYAAKVATVDGDAAHVRYLNGAEARVGKHGLREATFAPGTTYEYHSKSMGMYIKGHVARYNREKMLVTFSAWGDEETVPLSKIRTIRERTRGASKIGAWLWVTFASLGSGLLGAVVTWSLMR